MIRPLRVLQRILRGEDVVIITQSRESWEAQFKRGLWDRLADRQPNTEYIAKYIAEKGFKKVLDVGCGNGGLAKSLLVICPEVEITGIDISETAIFQASKITSRAHWIVDDITRPPIDRGQFDIIVFNEVLYYVDIGKVLPQYRPLLKSEGEVIISIVRSWRSIFLIWRIRAFVKIVRHNKISSKLNSWDIWTVNFI